MLLIMFIAALAVNEDVRDWKIAHLDELKANTDTTWEFYSSFSKRNLTLKYMTALALTICVRGRNNRNLGEPEAY